MSGAGSYTRHQLFPSWHGWTTMLSISVADRLAHRGDFFVGTLFRFLPIVTQIFLWTAVFSAAGTGTIAGYSRNDFVAYYLLTMMARSFSSMPGLAGGIARSVRDGSVKKYLVQPVDYVGFLMAARVAHKLVYFAIAATPFGLMFFLCRSFFPPMPEIPVIVAFLATLVMSFLLGFFLEATLGMLGFWVLEVSSLIFVYMLAQYLLSGHMFPLDMLDSISLAGSAYTLGDLVQLLPFQYTAYFPCAVWLGKIQGAELAYGLIIEAVWVVVAAVACRIAFLRGTRRYSAYGG
jgi:ABC-2 type transport system permease protein